MTIFKRLSGCKKIRNLIKQNAFEKVNIFEKIFVPGDKRIIVRSTVPTSRIGQRTCCIVTKSNNTLIFPDSSKIKEYDDLLYRWANTRKHFCVSPRTSRQEAVETFHAFYTKRLDEESIVFMSKFFEPKEDVLDRVIFLQQKSSFGMGIIIDELPIIRLPKQLNHIMISFTKDGKQRVYLQFSTS
jgi:hypothetical protein